MSLTVNHEWGASSSKMKPESHPHYTGRFKMYSGITKIYYPKPVGHVFFSLGICQRPGIRRTIAT